jgi:hypothetical protein
MRLLLLLAFTSLSGCVIHVYPASADGLSRHSDREVRQILRGASERERMLRQENLDALAVTAVRIASDVQAWARKPRAFGGGDGRFEGVTFEQMGYERSPEGWFLSMDGSFRMETDPHAVCVVGENTDLNNRVATLVTGFGASDIVTQVGTAQSCL